jgi:hypothetical protein
MSLSDPSKRAGLRTLAVVTLSLIVLVAGGLDFRRIWVPIGNFGYQLDGDDVVAYVADGSPAARAGMLVGDIVDLPSTPPQFRYYAVESGTLEAGRRPLAARHACRGSASDGNLLRRVSRRRA